MTKKRALLVLDLINDIVDATGQYGAAGYAAEIEKRDVLKNVGRAINISRSTGIPVIYVVIGFEPAYLECPVNSPLLAVAKREGRLLLNTWATEVHPSIRPLEGEAVIVKSRINPFAGTTLDYLLRGIDVDTLILTGVSTEFVVLATTLAAHDLDYKVVVLEDCTAASTIEHHDAAIGLLGHLATVDNVENYFATTGR